MKKLILTISIIGIFTTLSLSQNRTLPSVEVKTLDGSNFNIKNLKNNGKPIVISFWFMQCKPCIKELNAIAEVYEDWQEETGVKLVAISIDNTRSSKKVKPFVNANDWDYEVYLDVNKDFKRAMGVNAAPHTFLLNEKKEIVWEHVGYNEGDEDELYEKIEEIAK